MCHCSYKKCNLWNPIRSHNPPIDSSMSLTKYLNKLILFSGKKDSSISDIIGWPGSYWIKMTFELNTNKSPIREYIKHNLPPDCKGSANATEYIMASIMGSLIINKLL